MAVLRPAFSAALMLAPLPALAAPLTDLAVLDRAVAAFTGQQIGVPGGAAQPVALTADEVARLGDGAVGVTAVQTDAAGNASPLAVATFSLDTTAPTVTPTAPAAAARRERERGGE
jgi:hypothetical protein